MQPASGRGAGEGGGRRPWRGNRVEDFSGLFGAKQRKLIDFGSTRILDSMDPLNPL